MTEGDITRLNRMYKCPDFVEEEMIKKESEEQSSDNQPPKYFINDEVAPPSLSLNDKEINDEVMMEGEVMEAANVDNEELPDSKSLVKVLQSLTFQMLEILKPLCDFQKKIRTVGKLLKGR